ncbi:MAG: amidohydrolase [Bacteroidales bacterium]
MSLNKNLLRKLIELRKHLHKHPELSGREKLTAKTLHEHLSLAGADEIITGIGGHGIAGIYDSKHSGPTVLIRADMDALPIQESNNFDYKSEKEGVAHLCGHDGHSAILTGLAYLLKEEKPAKGRVVLLFQPSEETGEGAALVINDKKFSKIKPDYSFALHNLPGFDKGTIYTKEGSFASASTGIIVKLKGLSSHAAHPEDGNNPDITMAHLVLGLNKLVSDKSKFKDFTLLTVIHTKLGERAFGTTPGNAVVMATLRTYLNDDMVVLKKEAEDLIKKICKEHEIKYDISYVEEFPATVNDSECTNFVMKSASELNITTKTLAAPFRWSEDFGHFTQQGKGVLFGIGSGVNHPQLHNEDYDFPDEIIEPALLTFEKIIRKINK